VERSAVYSYFASVRPPLTIEAGIAEALLNRPIGPMSAQEKHAVLDIALRTHAQGTVPETVQAVTERLGISRATLYRYLSQADPPLSISDYLTPTGRSR
jgi:hypothetical protein